MKRIIPDAKDMKKKEGKSGSAVFLCIVTIIAATLIFIADDIRDWMRSSPSSEIHYSLYQISDECMNTFYKDQITEDGLVFSTDGLSIPAECRAQFLGSGTIEVTAFQTSKETHEQSAKAYLRMKDLGANLMHIDKIITTVPETNSHQEYQFEDENRERLEV